MGHYVANGMGDSLDNPSRDEMREFLDAIDVDDEEHGAAWISDDSGRSLEWNGNGVLVRSRDSQPSEHIAGVSKAEALELWVMFVEARFDEIDAVAWRPGPRPQPSPEETARRERARAEWQIASDREFYEKLGTERAGVPCRRSGCIRGAIEQSVLCKAHHFESIRNRPCPFDD